MTRTLALRIQAYPTDLNPMGTVFGGWIMSMMDRAASIAVNNLINTSAVTISVSDLHFIEPIQNGDVVTIYTTITNVGKSSISIFVEVEVLCKKQFCNTGCQSIVTDGVFKFVAIDKNRRPTPVIENLRSEPTEELKKLIEKADA